MIDILLILVGKTASGKDAIVKELVKNGWDKVVTYTTRPIREGEKEDITYHYISDEEFKEKIDSGFFLEYKKYDTEYGVWYYGSPKEELLSVKADENKVIILTPDGYRDFVKEALGVQYRCIYIYSNSKTIQKRLKRRGDSPLEAKRRLDNDNIDFKGVENEVDRIFYNNDNTNVEYLASAICKYIEKQRSET